MSFGEAFGRLIKEKRGVEGLTQEQLAVLAFGDESYKTRISELENGRVSNPQSKTVDAITVALKLTREELTELSSFGKDRNINDEFEDFIDFSSMTYGEFSLESGLDGVAYMRHNLPLRVNIVRFEFFHDLQQLVVLTEDGFRRVVSLPIPERVLEFLSTADSFRTVLVERGPQPSALEIKIYPLKYIS